VIAELASGGVEQNLGLVLKQRRQRIFATARRFEYVAAVDLRALQVASLARHAELVFRAVVERLEIGVAQWPVRKRGVGRDRGCAVALDGL
jgi:hypothetical protein